MSALHLENEDINPQYSISRDAEILADVYQDNTNIVIWRRNLSKSLENACDDVMTAYPSLQLSLITNPEDLEFSLNHALKLSSQPLTLIKDISNLADMFSCLFDIKRIGLRLTVLNKAMCPKFHVDHVACRLVTTYHGQGTEWLPNSQREPGCNIKENIQYTDQGDVVLLKGEGWEGNEGNGIIHRSPEVSPQEPRLLLTLDIVDR
jgi:hypothetical protein